MRSRWLSLKITLGLLLGVLAHPLAASETQRRAVDDAGKKLGLTSAAQRIATLARGDRTDLCRGCR